MKVILFFLIFIIVAILILILLKTLQAKIGSQKANKEYDSFHPKKIDNLGTVKSLEFLPLVDFYAKDDSFKTEAGVSYLIKADDTTILLDVGFNSKKENPSPLIHNMNKLDVKIEDIDYIFFSHAHLDHLGGMKEQKNKEFSLTQGKINLAGKKVFAPTAVNPSKFNPDAIVEVINNPVKIKNGIASIGTIPRFLFMMGYVEENALAINLKGKGIVIFVGCGHQTVEKIIERAKQIFDEPIYAIIGGLHYPVNGGRIMAGPINLQNLVGCERPIWNSLNENDVKHGIDAMNKEDLKIVGLSPHDSSDWSIEQFKSIFGDKYREVNVGEKIIF